MPDYNPNIPQPTDRPSKSQAEMLANFGQANLIFGYDHVTFNDSVVANRGFSNQVTLISQGGDPALPAGTGRLYTKQYGGGGGQAELFYKNGNTPAVTRLTPTLAASTYCEFLAATTVGTYIAPASCGLTFNISTIQVIASGPLFNVKFTFAGPMTNTDYLVVTNGFRLVFKNATDFTVTGFGAFPQCDVMVFGGTQ